MVNWANRPIKKYARVLVAALSDKKKKRALFFPADHADDGLVLKRLGVINGLTRIFIAEKDPDNIAKASAVLHANKLGNCKGRGLTLATGKTLCNFSLECPYGVKFDFVWFDYCGFFMNREAEWSSRFAHLYMTPSSDVWFTFQAVVRGRGKADAYFQHVEMATPEAVIYQEIKTLSKLTTMHVRDDGTIYDVPASPAMLRAVAIRRIGLRLLYKSYDFDLTQFAYKDRDPATQDDRGPGMILFHLHNIRPK